MTDAIAFPEIPGRTHPIARVSRGAIEANLTGHPKELFVDARHDGWGHGEELVTAIARERGFAGVRTSAGDIAFAGEVPEGGSLTTPALTYGFLDGTRPALSLIGHVLGVKTLLAGEGVSYGYTHRAERDTRVALVTGGYAQGIVRSLGNRLTVLVAGERRPIVGRVAMDVCVIDVADVAVEAGDEVVYLGDPDRGEPSIHEWAKLTRLTPEELIVPLGATARREIVA